MLDSDRPILYINVIVKDASEAVKELVHAKVKRSILIPTKVKKVAGKHIGLAASELTGLPKIAKLLSRSMCQEVPELMKEQGVIAEVSEAFREGAYFVLQMQILYVNFAVMSVETEAISSCYTEWAEYFMGMMGSGYQRSLESDYLPNLVHKSLATEMPKMLEEKMTENKIRADTNVLKDKHQARYFFETLRQLKERTAVRKRNNPIRIMRRKISSASSGASSKDTSSSNSSTCALGD